MHETEHPPAVSGDQNEGIDDGTIGTCLHTDQKPVLRHMAGAGFFDVSYLRFD